MKAIKNGTGYIDIEGISAIATAKVAEYIADGYILNAGTSGLGERRKDSVSRSSIYCRGMIVADDRQFHVGIPGLHIFRISSGIDSAGICAVSMDRPSQRPMRIYHLV